MTEHDCGADNEANEELRLMTRVDGEEARLLVHIEPIEDSDTGAETEDDPPPFGE